jgi:hypothetical protein
MDKTEMKSRAVYLVARMLKSLPVDKVCQILADAEYAHRFKAFPSFPSEVARRDTASDPIRGGMGVPGTLSDPVVKGFKKLADDLAEMWLSDPPKFGAGKPR